MKRSIRWTLLAAMLTAFGDEQAVPEGKKCGTVTYVAATAWRTRL